MAQGAADRSDHARLLSVVCPGAAQRFDLGRTQPAEALAHFATAARLGPSSAPAHFNLANCLVILGRPADAIPHYELAASLLPDNAQILVQLSRALAATGHIEPARARYNRARTLDATLPAPDF